VLLRREDLPEDPGTAREAVDELLAAVRRFAESTSHGAKLAVIGPQGELVGIVSEGDGFRFVECWRGNCALPWPHHFELPQCSLRRGGVFAIRTSTQEAKP
jgi:hypothetical protein